MILNEWSVDTYLSFFIFLSYTNHFVERNLYYMRAFRKKEEKLISNDGKRDFPIISGYVSTPMTMPYHGRFPDQPSPFVMTSHIHIFVLITSNPAFLLSTTVHIALMDQSTAKG